MEMRLASNALVAPFAPNLPGVCASVAATIGSYGLPVEPFNELVGLIYEGPLEPVPWSSALCLLHRHLGASWVSLIFEPRSSRPHAVITRSGLDGPEVFHAAYDHARMFALDPFDSLQSDQVATIDEVMDTRPWVAGELYKRYIEPNQIRYILGSDIRVHGFSECRLRIMRPALMRDFSEHDKQFCRLLIPHLRRALQLRSHVAHLELERRLYAVAIDRLQVGVIGLDAQGSITYSNDVAAGILAEQDGLLASNGRLRAVHAGEDRALQKLIASCHVRQTPVVTGAVSLTRAAGQPRLGVLVRAMPGDEAPDGKSPPPVAVFLRDPRQHSNPTPEIVAGLFGLTPAESALALQLAKGATLDEAAASLNIRRTTARAHLRAIFQKTGVTRQAMLVRLLLNSVVSVG